jgi:hypothetical protein
VSTEVAARTMTEAEAMIAVKQINHHIRVLTEHISGLRGVLDRFDREEGWRALGYSSFRACVIAEFHLSASALWRETKAIEMLRSMGVEPGENGDSTAALVALREVGPEARKDVLEAASKDGPPTAKAVKDAAREFADQGGDGPAPVRSTAGGREPGEDDDIGDEPPPARVKTDAERELEWVETLPVAQADPPLAPKCMRLFVADARIWRRMAEARGLFIKDLSGCVHGATYKETQGVVPPAARRLQWALKAKGPHEWRVCSDCSGQGVREILGQAEKCPTCEGNGYQTGRF